MLPVRCPNLSEGADRVGGQQLRGDEECHLQWRSQSWQSLEDGAGKLGSDCDTHAPLPSPYSRLKSDYKLSELYSDITQCTRSMGIYLQLAS